jgi:hypothetical protein
LSALLEHQQRFARLVGVFLMWIHSQPQYALTLGQTKRTAEEAEANAVSGAGITNSLHRLSLAIDLNLFINGAYVTDSESHRPLGEYWKSLDPDCAWGGDFHGRQDGNHYSLSFNGVK